MNGLTVIALLACVVYTTGYPIHASCKVTWTFGITCDEVRTKLKNQIAAWSNTDNCPNAENEKCLYHFDSDTATVLKFKHETPRHHYIDDVTMTFTPSGTSCNVKGYSTSEVWYAHLDQSTNYCNMANLISGSGLDQTNGYTETTDDSICTQYSKRNCAKY